MKIYCNVCRVIASLVIFTACYTSFTHTVLASSLKLGDNGAEVTILQKALNLINFPVAMPGLDSTGNPLPGSPGYETSYFGPQTAAALKAFQCAKGIVCSGSATSTGWGVFGPITKAIIRSFASLDALYGSASSDIADVGVAAVSSAVSSATASKMYGAGAPFTIADLPPGQLRSRLLSLPPSARARAMNWLHSFSFPAEDLDSIRLDDTGAVFYVDNAIPPGSIEQAVTADTVISSEALSLTDVFTLHSRPGATRIVYLDFDGAIISGTNWNSSYGVTSWTARPYSIDSYPNSFSADELARIHEIWHRMSEDLSAFDIDVTTENPGTFGPNVGRVLLTHSESGSATPFPYANAGGVAYINVWGTSYYTNYQPAFVYYNNLGNGNPTYLSEAVSHEFGHNLGLSHDGTNSGTTYYSGHGTGYVSWAPIMGNSYSSNVTQWSKGEYSNSNQLQDDIAIIVSKLTRRVDDHSNIPGPQATPLRVDSAGLVAVSNPQTDPENLVPFNKGVIESRSDVDVFAFNTSGGLVNLKVTPAWNAFYRIAKRGSNVDVSIALYNSSGVQIASANPNDDTFASLSLDLSPGVYYLAVDGIGHSVNYSDYGSIGEYFISGNIPPSTSDVTAPTPNPMQFSLAPHAVGSNSIDMTSIAATDASGVVEYQFNCSSLSAICAISSWQSARSYVATGLSSSTTYQFQVRARDLSGNTTQWSDMASATTPAANQVPVAMFASSCSYLNCMFTDQSQDSDGTIAAWNWSFGDGSTSALKNPQHVYAINGLYTVSLTVMDDKGANATVVKTFSVDAPPIPDIPTDLIVVDGKDGTAVLTWIDRSTNESGFSVQREKQTKRGIWGSTATIKTSTIGDVSTGQTESYVDAAGAGTVRYRIRAENGTSFSAWTPWAEVLVTTSSTCKGSKCP